MELADFRGHSDMVTCCALSNSGKFVVSSSEDNTVRVWETHRKTSIAPGNERVKKSPLMLEFKGHQYGVQCCAIAPDESLVISADIDSCIMLWEPLNGKVISRWRLSSPSPLVSPVLMESKPSFPAVYLPQRSASPSGTEGVLSCAFSPDGTMVVTGTQTGAVLVWNTRGKLLGALSGHKSQVRCCVFDQIGSFLATACLGDFSAKIWNLSSQNCKQTLVHSCAVLSCDFSPDQERLVTGNTEGAVLVWSVSDGTQLEEYLLHSDHVNCVLYSPTQPHILSAADNGIVKTDLALQIQWNDEREGAPSSRSKVSHAHYHRRFSAQFKEHDSGYSARVLCYNRKLKYLQLVQGSKANVVVPAVLTLFGRTPRSWNLSSDGNLIVVGFEDGALQVISVLKEGHVFVCQELWHVECAHKSTIRKAFFSPDNSKLVTCSETQHKTWSVQSGDSLAVINGSGLGVKPVIFFQDSHKLASAQEKGVIVWYAETGDEAMLCSGIVECEDSIILCLNLSQDNRRLVASNSAGLVMVWCMVTGEPLLISQVPLRSPCARSCALSPNGCVAAAGFDDGALKIWQVSTLQSSQEISHCSTNSSYWMIDVGFSPGGDKVVTLCDTIEVQ
ncbi:Uncharacterized WD repeat-containing protein alr2800 [Geodia barretti]|uniref:Uncharacterized WD repeat-containing protein alr2800 n=1 Tax=Geodia barretti TaxID=519541 RepID=A0AA35RED2_GEOBA|nr:Uncharacterized WD repeat-containing protein alr2800 [Geodia barretti]